MAGDVEFVENIGDIDSSQKESKLIPFGRFIRINPTVRLKQYDNGLAKAYEAFDERDKSKTFIALISSTELLPRCAATTAYNNLADTSFMRLIGSGIVYWPFEGRQKYAFLYAGNLGGPLVPEGGFNVLQWRHPDVVENLIQPVARMLREMADKSFSHGSIRVDNIFHSSIDRKGQVILGDCLAVQPGSTQPALYMTIGKAMADPMGRGNGSLQDDIYAFGVMLAMALRKNDDLSGVNPEEIIKRKIEFGSYATIIGKERFQASFLELLRGLLHDDPTVRWGVEDIFSWLDGTRMNPAPLAKRKKATRPLPFNDEKYLFTDLLALDLHKNPIELRELVEDGRIMQWIDKSLNHSDTTDRYIKFLERLENSGGPKANPDLFLASMRLVLNPLLPIRYKGKTFTHDGLGAMMARAFYEGESMSLYREVINSNLLDMAAGYKCDNQNELMAMLRLFDGCRSSLKLEGKIGYGMARCIYLMCKNTPCLSPKFKKFFVYDHKTALLTYEKLCSEGNEVALLMDDNVITFFAMLNPNGMDQAIYDLTAETKEQKILGNLRYMAIMQKNGEGHPCPAIAKVFVESVSRLSKFFKNVKLRKQVEDGVRKAAEAGDLVTMASFFDDQKLMARDQLGFKRAVIEYRTLQKEYNEYNKRLANKKTYGVVNGRDAAAVVSWVVSTIITLIVVFSYISGF